MVFERLFLMCYSYLIMDLSGNSNKILISNYKSTHINDINLYLYGPFSGLFVFILGVLPFSATVRSNAYYNFSCW